MFYGTQCTNNAVQVGHHQSVTYQVQLIECWHEQSCSSVYQTHTS